MLAAIKRAFTKPAAPEAAQAELAEAELALLQAHTGLEWAEALVRYQTTRTERLRAYVERTEKPS